MADQFSERLKLALGDRSIVELAAAVDIAPNTLRTYMSGVMPKFTIGFALARNLGVCPEWLALGSGSMLPSRNADLSIDTKGNMIIPYLPHECFSSQQTGWHESRAELIAGLSVSSDWIRFELGEVDLNSLRVLYIEGDSMVPYLRNGNLVFVSMIYDETDITEGVYVLRFSGNLVVRRVQYTLENKYLLRPENHSYGDYEVERSLCSYGVCRPDCLVSFVGRILYVGHKL